MSSLLALQPAKTSSAVPWEERAGKPGDLHTCTFSADDVNGWMARTLGAQGDSGCTRETLGQSSANNRG